MNDTNPVSEAVQPISTDQKVGFVVIEDVFGELTINDPTDPFHT